MARFYCESKYIIGDKINLHDKEKIHHIKDVLRLKIGEGVVVFDEKGYEYKAKIINLGREGIDLQIESSDKANLHRKIFLTVACAIPKKSKIDDIIDKLTQLGVDRIIPLSSERVIVRLGKEKKAERQQRWEKIALAAAQQSQRNKIPVVSPVTDFKAVLVEAAQYDLKLIPTLIDQRKTLKEILAKSQARKVFVLIGPEGDFSPQEVASARNAGFIPVTFGATVLRVETACAYIASILNYEFS